MPSSVVLLSAGLDSAYNLLKARENFSPRLALTFDYGQRAGRRECEQAALLAKHFQVPHAVIELPWFAKFTNTALLGRGEIPHRHAVDIDDLQQSLKTAKSVWVPNRNGIFLNIAAGFAEGVGADFVIPGFNIEEAQTFPDNSAEYLAALDQSWRFSTATKVRTHCFSATMNKSQIVADGIMVGLPFAKLWPCYRDGATWCGECESCLRFKRALAANGLNFDELKAAK
jgi:7-cyano-7-deazaguanine synthase